MAVHTIVYLLIAAVAIYVLLQCAIVVPQQSAYIRESFGQYSGTLAAGLHFLVPFYHRITYKHTLKEQAVDIQEQICITKDNVQVTVDGIIYLQVTEPHLASYGVADYVFAITQLAQTTLRSEIGKIELDRTFEERTAINAAVVHEIQKACSSWGVKVLRYEIRNITPPADVLAAMEKQMRAEREKRAQILASEGVRDAAVNTAEGDKQRVIKESEAAKQKHINEAEGQAAAILAVADATAEGLRRVADALVIEGGAEAMQLRLAEAYVQQLGKMAKEGNTFVVPANLTDVASMIGLATSVFKKTHTPAKATVTSL